MIRKALIITFLIFIGFILHEISGSDNLFADIKLGGMVRNDAIVSKVKDDAVFTDILESRLEFTALSQSEDWKFYTDARVYLYYGKTPGNVSFDAKVLRSFIRYFSPIGNFTLGKTYINFGNPGLFNPFEMNKTINFSDLKYDRDGILSFEYDLSVSTVFFWKIYGSPEYKFDNSSYGTSIGFNAGGFDFGAVANRKTVNSNIAGVYFKGDLFFGVQGAYAMNFNDIGSRYYSEANFGIDYSFLEGNLVLSALFYYNENGAQTVESYVFSPNAFLFAKYYIYSNITGKIDDFTSLHISAFFNLIDGSILIIPGGTFKITNGLTIIGQLLFMTGDGRMDFSRDRYSDFSVILRVEGKF
jgi:hypothetical protein